MSIINPTAAVQTARNESSLIQTQFGLTSLSVRTFTEMRPAETGTLM